MLGANLSEVWEDYKPTKKKKKKDKPLTPSDMESTLLERGGSGTIEDERERLSSLVDDREKDYRYERINPNVVTFDNPYGLQRRSSSNIDNKKIDNNPRPFRIEDDPDYREFLEFKRNKNSFKRNTVLDAKPKFQEKDQLNELILYIFTGFFLIIIYDNIYKLGKNSY